MMPASGHVPPVGPPLVPIATHGAPAASRADGGVSVSRGTSLIVEAQSTQIADAAHVAALLRWCRAGALLTRLSDAGVTAEERLRFFQARRRATLGRFYMSCRVSHAPPPSVAHGHS